jgi:hypothetical protein
MAWQASTFEREVLYDPFEVLGIDHVRELLGSDHLCHCHPSCAGLCNFSHVDQSIPSELASPRLALLPPLLIADHRVKTPMLHAQGSTERQIKKRYHLLSLKYHPDKNPDSEDTFVRIAKAYQAYVARIAAAPPAAGHAVFLSAKRPTALNLPAPYVYPTSG